VIVTNSSARVELRENQNLISFNTTGTYTSSAVIPWYVTGASSKVVDIKGSTTIYYNAILPTAMTNVTGTNSKVRATRQNFIFTGASGAPSGLSVTMAFSAATGSRADLSNFTFDGISYIPPNSPTYNSSGVIRSYNTQVDKLEGGLQTGNVNFPGTTSGSYTVQENDYTIAIAPSTSTTVTVNLPSASLYVGRQIVIKNTATTPTCVISVTPASGQTIDGASSYTLNYIHSVIIQANQSGTSSDWVIIGSY
jgi:hypothetical protein